MKIAIYAICLNERGFVDRFMQTCKEADVVVIADTGSTDGTDDLFRKHGAQVHSIKVTPWRFDDARNAALALIPQDIDICLSLDVDEIPAPGWRQAIENCWTPETTRGRYRFVASHHADGSPGVEFLNTRIHSRHGYRWRHACHEGLYPDRTTEHYVLIDGLRVDHWPDSSKSRSSYLGLLETAAAEEPNEPRMAHYLAREYYYCGRHAEAIAEFQRYLAFNGSFLPERVASLIYIGKCVAAQNGNALPWYHRAIAELPTIREPWIALAEACYLIQDWPGCYAAAVKGLSIPLQPDGYMSDPHCYGATPDDLAALGAWNLGMKQAAVIHARAALQYAPEDERLRKNLVFMESESLSEAPTVTRRHKAGRTPK